MEIKDVRNLIAFTFSEVLENEIRKKVKGAVDVKCVEGLNLKKDGFINVDFKGMYLSDWNSGTVSISNEKFMKLFNSFISEGGKK